MAGYLKVAWVTILILIVAIAGVLGLLVGWVAWRQHVFASRSDTADLDAQVAKMAENYLASRPRAAIVIGLHQRGRDWIGGYGRAHASGEAVPNTDSVFEIGSITKVFTGIALAQLTGEGVVTPDDPLAKHLPATHQLAADARTNITLRQLSTHSSGLPRLAGDFWQVATNQDNPYVDYSADQLFADVTSVKLQHAPGTRYDYSNYGTALLGNLLARAADESYASLLQRIVLQPLQLKSTSLMADPQLADRLVPGHAPGGGPVPGWDFAGFAPAGALRSTGTDMLAFIRFCLQPDDSPLGKAVQVATTVQSEVSGQKVGLGWHLRETVEGLELWWHNGGTGGYASFLAIDRKHQTGVIVMASSGDAMAGKFDVDKIGMSIMQLAAKVSLPE